MGVPRFNNYWREDAVRVSKRDFKQEGMPLVFKNTTWKVAAEYWVEEEPEGDPIRLESWELPDAPIYELKITDSIEKNGKVVKKAARIAGEYIYYPHQKHSQEPLKGIPIPDRLTPIFTREYNPITDTPDLFLSFSRVGQRSTPDKVKILNFVRQYGVLRYHEPKTMFLFHSYPLEAFHQYAREANLTLSLYEAILNKNYKKIPLTLSSWISELPMASWFLLKLVSLESFFIRWQNKLPHEIIKEAVNCSSKIRHIDNKDLNSALLDWVVNNSGVFWELLIAHADNEILFDVACKVVSRMPYYRIGNIIVDCVYTLPHESRLKKVEFKPQWYAESLLGHIWLLFFLKIIGQTEQSYKVCPVCEKPIENPRKNQTFHPGCRQAYYNRRKRETLQMWKNGKSIELISRETGIDVDQITRWVNKLKEVSRNGKNKEKKEKAER